MILEQVAEAGMSEHGAFWDDLARDLEDPDFLREYVAESMRIATIDRVLTASDMRNAPH